MSYSNGYPYCDACGLVIVQRKGEKMIFYDGRIYHEACYQKKKEWDKKEEEEQ